MKNPHFVKQNNCDTASFTLTDLGPQFTKEGFEVSPRNVGASRVGKDRIERTLMLPLHG